MKISKEVFDFFAQNLEQTEDLLTQYEAFKDELADRFTVKLAERVQNALEADGWLFVNDTHLRTEQDHAGARAPSPNNNIQVVLGSSTRARFPFSVPYIGVRSTEKMCNTKVNSEVIERLYNEIQSVLEEQDLRSFHSGPKDVEYWINGAYLEGWLNTTHGHLLKGFWVEDDDHENLLISDVIYMLSKLKSVVIDVLG